MRWWGSLDTWLERRLSRLLKIQDSIIGDLSFIHLSSTIKTHVNLR
jgi:hypothetical protein